ncbi:DUF302 domain-containing protein [Guptibacillus hwajinpoensis]|uniref:Uncharacterized protein (DUF302 family) n=2 Tax=Guptibacillus hwajinpoensis TaxID=208199 RepID=A0ABU0JZU6_9BACL|nr:MULTISPECIES: DUF302 domain-containing protein [Alkalihalobacillus]KMM37922.1 hypothetical protein AB986_00875 [Alkalihalobacillus macyae]MDP4550144.1 DUF302 domain-containing protein [Alkalihalobacillus macyae]MDQ0481766.1 uncharacterized protein (DUF302 family) [Alkalihalobacillus hemicentroti]
MSFHYTVETSKTVDQAVTDLSESLQEEKFGVLWDFDLTSKLQEKGMDFNTPYRVLEVCNPKEAERVLSEDKLVGYFLPCKIVVFDDEGQTKIGMPKPTTLLGLTGDDQLNDIGTDIEKRLVSCIDNSK